MYELRELVHGKDFDFTNMLILHDNGDLDSCFITAYRDVPGTQSFGDDYHEDDAIHVWGIAHLNIYTIAWEAIPEFLDAMKSIGWEFKEI